MVMLQATVDAPNNLGPSGIDPNRPDPVGTRPVPDDLVRAVLLNVDLVRDDLVGSPLPTVGLVRAHLVTPDLAIRVGQMTGAVVRPRRSSTSRHGGGAVPVRSAPCCGPTDLARETAGPGVARPGRTSSLTTN